MKPFVCECGRILPPGTESDPAHLAIHRNSLWHRHGREVAKLLQDSTLRCMDIAQRVGISIDDAERMVKELGGPTGIDRRFFSNAARQVKDWWATTGRHPVVQKCKRMGFDVEPIGDLKWQLRLRRTTFLVNGHRVAFAGLWVKGEAQDGVSCMLKPKKSVEADFQIGHAEGMFYIFPQWLLKGINSATFTTGYARPMSRRANSVRPDYQKYRDAWHLLEKAKRVKREEAST